MTRRSAHRWTVALAAAALVAAATGVAQAADKSSVGGKNVDFTVRAEPTSAAPGANRILKYDASKGRLGLTLDFQQQNLREQTLGDVQAGAYYRITPSLRVGGSVTLGEQTLAPGAEPARLPEQPKVRLETKFKF